MNPLKLVDDLLKDWASPKVRRLIHSLLVLAAMILSIWLAVEGNWAEFVAAIVATVYAEANKANTPAQE